MFAEKKLFFNVWRKFKEVKKKTSLPTPVPGGNRLFRRIIETVKIRVKRSPRRSTRKMTKDLDISDSSIKEDCERRFKAKTIENSTMAAALKCFQAEGRKFWMRCSVLQTKFLFGQTRRFSLSRLRSTTSTIGFTPLHQETFPKVSGHISSDRIQLVCVAECF